MIVTLKIDKHDLKEDNYFRVMSSTLKTSTLLHAHDIQRIVSGAEEYAETLVDNNKEKYLAQYSNDINITLKIEHEYTQHCWKDELEHDLVYTELED
jgi:hypothetical protein